MAHNINLLQLPRQPRTDLLSLPSMLGLMLVAVVALAVTDLVLQQRIHQLAESVAQSRARSAAVVPTDNAAVLDQAQQQLAQRREALSTLEGRDLYARTGYAGHLQALARATVPGVWLAGFSVDQDGLQLHVHASAASRVGAYLASLRQEPLFAGQVFNVLDLKGPGAQGDAAAQALDLTLASSVSTDGKNGPRSSQGAQP